MSLRYGFAPSKIAFMALSAWEDAARGAWPPLFREDQRRAFDLATIRHWMEVFLRRFFAFSQFKRSAMPNGPKVSAGGSLSPRGDWRALLRWQRRGMAGRAERITFLRA